MSLPGRPEDTSLLGGYDMGYLSWITNGNQGVKLEAITLGGVIFTSVEAPERFVRRLDGEDPKVVPRGVGN
ncbi:hypothetical protein [Singulisphaera sp. PoT]|uniref:hypothetical protein n=1 Tax=Singulisphaera sp. PoT TaxID=3411797 RepID=UPI003BF4E5E9